MAGLPGLLGIVAMMTAAVPPSATPAIGPAAADAADTTAVTLMATDNRMTVDVTIDGAGPFRFIVDSGATRTVISGALADLLRLPEAGPVEMHSVGGASTVRSVRIAALALGGLPGRAVVAPVLDAADLGAAGILGIDALAGKKVVIDLVSHRMTILAADRHPTPAAADEIVVVARRKYGQLVLADADVAGQRIWAIVDTGSMISIGNSRLRDRLARRRGAASVATVITDVAGREIDAAMAPIGDMRLGVWHVRNMVIAFSDTHAFQRFGLADKPSMLLGMDMMGVFSRVSIDFARRTVRLLKRNDGEV